MTTHQDWLFRREYLGTQAKALRQRAKDMILEAENLEHLASSCSKIALDNVLDDLDCSAMAEYQTNRGTSWLHRAIYDTAWPIFDCEDCISMGKHRCYCAYNGASAAGVGPKRWHLFWRWVWSNRA